MAMKQAQIEQMVRRIARTLDEELACEECGKLTPECIDSLLSGQVTVEHWAMVMQHLEECSACAEEFTVLRHCAQMELDGTWPTIDRLLDATVQGGLNA